MVSSTCSLRLWSLLKSAVMGLAVSAVSMAPPAETRSRSHGGGMIANCEKAVKAIMSTRRAMGRGPRGAYRYSRRGRGRAMRAATMPETSPMPWRMRMSWPTMARRCECRGGAW